jgi:hypothetical protein
MKEITKLSDINVGDFFLIMSKDESLRHVLYLMKVIEMSPTMIRSDNIMYRYSSGNLIRSVDTMAGYDHPDEIFNNWSLFKANERN